MSIQSIQLNDLDETSLNEMYLSMKDSIIDVTKMDSNGISCLKQFVYENGESCLLYTSPSPRDGLLSRMPSSA